MDDLAALKIDRTTTQRRQRARSASSPWFRRSIVVVVLAGLAWTFYRPIVSFVDRIRLPRVHVILVAESHPASVGAVSGTAANGYIVAARRAALSADTPGRVVEMNVTEGSVVKRGEVVARLYHDEYDAALARAQSDTAVARAEVGRAHAAVAAAKAERERRHGSQQVVAAQTDEARAARRLAKSRLTRTENLHSRDVASEDDLDAARAELDGADARVATALARAKAAESASQDATHLVAIAEANLEIAKARHAVASATERQAQATLDKTYVRAPFDGIVVLKDAEVGEVVSPNSQGGGSTRGSVCTMVDFESLEVQADVPETSIAKVKIGAAANIYLDAYPGRTYSGRVSRIWPTASRQKASVEVRVEFDQRDQDLRPDLGVRVVFLAADQGPASEHGPTGEGVATAQILIPSDALVEIDGRFGAFVVQRDVVKFQQVEPGPHRGRQVSVRSGLEPGQRIVINPPSDLCDGCRVQILDAK